MKSKMTEIKPSGQESVQKPDLGHNVEYGEYKLDIETKFKQTEAGGKAFSHHIMTVTKLVKGAIRVEPRRADGLNKQAHSRYAYLFKQSDIDEKGLPVSIKRSKTSIDEFETSGKEWNDEFVYAKK